MSVERYSIRVTKDYLVFCCAHFITYEGDDCERLHGHNYRVAVEVDGELDENHYVFDFIALKNLTRSIVNELDHHMLVATLNPQLPVTTEHGRVVVRFGTKHWDFPAEDCRLLPIANTTTELLAKYVATRILDDLKTKRDVVPEVLRVELEECFGQVARYEWRDTA
jgi:6-pyruvoyltetrahydropterin/6-carboxytetrahydropterin synthase